MHKQMEDQGYVTPEAYTTGHIRVNKLIGHGKGCVAGDIVALREGGPTGEIKARIVASSANGEFGEIIPDGAEIVIKNPVFCSIIKSSGTIVVDIGWK